MSNIRKAQPLAGFALAWRWREDGPHPLPPAALARLQALPAAAARAVFASSAGLLHADGLDAQRFGVQSPSGRTPTADWLRALPPPGRTAVYLSWEPELALRGDWSVFVRHWPAFCQPGSDDLVVFPRTQRWALFHRRDGQLQFGLGTSFSQASGHLQDTPAADRP